MSLKAPVSLRGFERIVFFTGAGLSAESGLPTYRGQGGIWNEYRYEEYACQEAFDRDPEKVWDFHDLRREKVASVEPNAGHRVIAAVEAEKPATRIVTQNIDGLHQRAGCTQVTELHGSLWRIRCPRTGEVQENRETPINSRICPSGCYWRPDIVWFGDMLRADCVLAAQTALEECDCLVSIGTSAAVYPAADMPRIAMAAGAVTVEINLEDTPVSQLYQHTLRGKASEWLEALWGE